MSNITPVPPKALVTRAWNDLAPKLLAFLTGGTAATALVAILSRYFDITLDPGLAGVIVVVAGTILGYVVKDKAPIDAGTVTAGVASNISSLPVVATAPPATVNPIDTYDTSSMATPAGADEAVEPDESDPAPAAAETPADPAAPLAAIETTEPVPAVPADPANVQ